MKIKELSLEQLENIYVNKSSYLVIFLNQFKLEGL